MGSGDLGGGGAEFWRAEAERLAADNVALRARVAELEDQIGGAGGEGVRAGEAGIRDLVGEGGQAGRGRARARTVRRWIRAVRDPAHVEWLRTQGVVWLARVDLDVINTLVPQATRLGDALTALAAAALTLRARVVPQFRRGRWSGRSPTAGSLGRRCRPGPAEIPLLPGPRAPANRRHRDDGEPARPRPARGAVTTTATP